MACCPKLRCLKPLPLPPPLWIFCREQLCMTRLRSSTRKGFSRNSSMPASLHLSCSALSVSADSAMILGRMPCGKRCMMQRVASRPSISGMWMSMRMRSYTFSSSALSTCRPFSTTSGLQLPATCCSTFSTTFWLTLLSSAMRMRGGKAVPAGACPAIMPTLLLLLQLPLTVAAKLPLAAGMLAPARAATPQLVELGRSAARRAGVGMLLLLLVYVAWWPSRAWQPPQGLLAAGTGWAGGCGTGEASG
mmetsp:Transcript_21719/g.60234  ORF Transcript_21719/g.60234 Transcript_21719/m.60234 type:complete len:248 (-) Transcript_21719:865-1608(-)